MYVLDLAMNLADDFCNTQYFFVKCVINHQLLHKKMTLKQFCIRIQLKGVFQ